MVAVASSIYRRQILSKRESLSRSTLLDLSRKIVDNLKDLDEYRMSRIPLIYVSFRSEVETHPLIRERINKGLEVAVPKTDIPNQRLEIYLLRNWDRDLRLGAYGVLEPDTRITRRISPSQLDLILVPGSVFDRRCGRYGYGKGYYDRFLEEAAHTLRVGLSFDIQLLLEIPLKPHDQRMDIIITETEKLQCSRSADSKI